MGINRGKDFEGVIRECFEEVADCSVDRIPDQTSGFMGSKNVCDFMIFFYPNLMYLECKSCYGNTLNFNNIPQMMPLIKKSNITGVIAGVMIWFIDHDRTIFVPAQTLEMYKSIGLKSVNIKNVQEGEYIEVEGKKKRIFFHYNMAKFLYEVRKCVKFQK